MKTYILKRLVLMPPVYLGVGIVVFIVIRVIPGNVVDLILAGQGGIIRPEDVEAVTRALGLDQPLLVQLGNWLWDILRFDFGNSLYDYTPVLPEIAKRLPLTVQIAIMALLLAVSISIPLGVLAGVYADSKIDYVIRVISLIGLAMPPFWLGIIILLGLVVFFNWLPPFEWARIWQDPAENLKALIWPTVSVAFRMSAVIVRMTRSTMLEVLKEDYVRTARAKGLTETIVTYRHALRNALLPVVTVIGFEIVVLLGGLIVTETVFNVPGIGRYLVSSVLRRDYTAAQAIIMLVTVMVLVVNLLVDLTYSLLDPRIRYA